MKISGSIFCVGIFVVGLTTLVGLGPAGAQDREKQVGILAGSEPAYDTSSFSFKRTRAGEDWVLSYRFKGLHDNWHEVTCRIRDADSRQLENAFGFRVADWNEAKVRYLQQVISEKRYIRELSYGVVRVTPAANPAMAPHVQWIQERVLFGVEIEVAEQEKKDFASWLEKNWQALSEEALAKFKNDRGFLDVSGLGWIPNYSEQVEKAALTLKNCVDALHRETAGQPENLMRFFQFMDYEKVPLEESTTGRKTGGLILPSTVMIRGEGDCDSKAAAFCTIQRRQPQGLVILRSISGKGSGKHALVGVEAWPRRPTPSAGKPSRKAVFSGQSLEEMRYEEPVLFGNRYYWPCEVAGSDKERAFYPAYGEVSPGHGGIYVVIPIR